NLEGLQAGAQGLVGIGVVAGVGLRNGRRLLVDEADDAPFGEVDHGDEALDGAGVAVGGGLLADVGDAAQDAAPFFVRLREVAGGPGVDLHLRDIVDAATADGGLPIRIVARDLAGLDELLVRRVGLHA